MLFVIVLLRSIWMFTKFDTVWLMAGDGAVSRYIRTLPVYAYARSFTYLQAGMGAALAVMMFGMLLAATAVYFRLFRDEEVVSREAASRAALYAAGALLLVVGAFPLVWMLSTALKPSGEIFATPPALVPAASDRSTTSRASSPRRTSCVFFRNSVTVSLTTVLLTLTVSALGAYGLTRYAFAGASRWPASSC